MPLDRGDAQGCLRCGRSKRGSALWGAVRSMAIEVDEEAMIDFRLGRSG